VTEEDKGRKGYLVLLMVVWSIPAMLKQVEVRVVEHVVIGVVAIAVRIVEAKDYVPFIDLPVVIPNTLATESSSELSRLNRGFLSARNHEIYVPHVKTVLVVVPDRSRPNLLPVGQSQALEIVESVADGSQMPVFPGCDALRQVEIETS
jgi:hypothetical protein